MEYQNIALVGLRGSGKDTVASRLISHHGYVKMSWADPVRTIAAMAYDRRFISSDPKEYSAAKAATFSVRRRACGSKIDCGCAPITERITGTQVLQRIGTDAIRDGLDLDFWIKAGLRTIEVAERVFETIGKAARWVNTDTRFPNEVKALRDLGWKIVGLSVNEEVRRNRLIERDGFYDEAAQSHPSETSLTLNDCDLIVDANAPVERVVERLLAVTDPDAGSFGTKR